MNPSTALSAIPSLDARRRAPVLLVILVYVVTLGGRYTLSRVGVEDLGELDLRLVGAPVLVAGVALWRLHPRWAAVPARWGTSTGWALALLGWLALSALWAPPGSPLAARLTDIVILAVLVLCTVVVMAPDPVGGARTLLWATFLGGAFYTVAGLVLRQTDVQGRLTLFGGGPNVFARVICLGILAAVVLAVVHRRWSLMVPIPFMAVAVVLSGSRGAVVAVAATTVVFLVVLRPRWLVRGIGVIVALLAVGVGVALATAGSSVQGILGDRFASILTADYSDRQDLFSQAWRMFGDHPVVGEGLGSFWAVYGRTVLLDYPHDILLDIASTGGLVALALLAGFVVAVIRACRPVRSLSLDRVGLVLASVYVLVESLFSGDLYDTRFFFVYAVAASVASVARPTRSGAVESVGARV